MPHALLLSGSLGQGHDVMAAACADSLHDRGWTTSTVDAMALLGRRSGAAGEAVFRRLLAVPGVYDAFHFSALRPGNRLARLTERAAVKRLAPRVRELLEREPVDLVVSVFATAAGAVDAVRRGGGVEAVDALRRAGGVEAVAEAEAEAVRRAGGVKAVAVRRAGGVKAVAVRRAGGVKAVAVRRAGGVKAVAVRRAGGVKMPPHMVFCTDVTPHRLWVHDTTDLFLVTSEAAAAGVRRYRPEATIAVVPAPLRPAFYAPPTMQEAREEFGVPSDARCVLLMSGAWGLGPVAAAAAALGAAGIHVLAVAGRNQALEARLRVVERGDPRVHALGYSDRIPALMAAADLVVTSSGDTCSEARAVGRRLVLLDVVPGHGRDNLQHELELGDADVTGVGAGDVVRAVLGALKRPVGGGLVGGGLGVGGLVGGGSVGGGVGVDGLVGSGSVGGRRGAWEAGFGGALEAVGLG